MSMTGLTIRHVGEHFQQLNNTISGYFQKILVTLSSQEMYSRYVQLPTREFVSSKIRDEPKFWLYFKNTIRAINGSHIHSVPHAFLCPNY
ncbi:hypothetical protein PAXRUDRAFT_121120, partial [Paxillus rubicundulus Ve08.2h10]